MNYEINKCITGHWACPRPHGKYKEIYPPRFLERLEVLIGPWTDKKILHLFCGSSKFGSVRIDINPEVNPDYLLDLSKDKLPFPDNVFDVVIADPPYHDFKPYSFVKEAVRVLKPLGYLVILHFLVYSIPKNCERWACISVGCGPNTRMRTLNIFRKRLSGNEKMS